MARTNDEIELEFKRLEEEKEDFMQQVKALKSHLESGEWEDKRQYSEIANMRENCEQGDTKIVEMLEHLEENLRKISDERSKLVDIITEAEKKKRIEWNILEERLYDEQTRINENAEED